MASCPVDASAINCMSGSFLMTAAMPSRMRGWSSTQKTRILEAVLIYLLASLCHASASRASLVQANGTTVLQSHSNLFRILRCRERSVPLQFQRQYGFEALDYRQFFRSVLGCRRVPSALRGRNAPLEDRFPGHRRVPIL